MRRRITYASALMASIAALIVVGMPQKAPAQRRAGCANWTLRGDYALHLTGSVESGPFAGPLAFVGLFNFDGFGHLTGKITLRRNEGANGPTTAFAQYQGNYTVNPDCTFEDTWN